jgi:hypothetical protein
MSLSKPELIETLRDALTGARQGAANHAPGAYCDHCARSAHGRAERAAHGAMYAQAARELEQHLAGLVSA